LLVCGVPGRAGGYQFELGDPRTTWGVLGRAGGFEVELGDPRSSRAFPGRVGGSQVELGGPKSRQGVPRRVGRSQVVPTSSWWVPGIAVKFIPTLFALLLFLFAMLSASLRRIGKGYLAMIVNRFRAYNIQLPFLYLCLPPLIRRCFGFPYAPAPANSIPTIEFRRLSSIRCPRCPMSVRPRFHPSDVHRRPSSAVLVGSRPVVWRYVVRII
jgi:hypothetical protein